MFDVHELSTGTERKRFSEDDSELVARIASDPAHGYAELLERYTPVLIRMIGRHMRDRDEVMEVYTTVCERLRADDYQVLRRLWEDTKLMPWLSVVAANTCRDRMRKNYARPVPRSVLAKLDAREQLIFRYYIYGRLPHEDMAEIISSKHGIACSALEVVQTIGKINELLSIRKRWLLLGALNASRRTLSLEGLAEVGFEPMAEDAEMIDEALAHREQLQQLKAVLDTFDGEDQLLIALWFDKELTAVQIAAMMHIENPKKVYTRLRTLVHRLRKYMTEEG